MQKRTTALFIIVAATFQMNMSRQVHRRLEGFVADSDLDFPYVDSSAVTDSATRRSITSLDYDLSVVITSNLIPSHPRIDFINRTIASLLHLDGLPYDTPIYITVDGISNTTGHRKRKKAIKDRRQKDEKDSRRLSKYIRRVQSASFYPFTNVQVLAMDQHRHISGSVNEALKHISNQTHYRYLPDNHFIYLLQHDLYFIERIPHDKVIGAMRESPDRLKNIRFRYNRGRRDDDKRDAFRFPRCFDVENGDVFERQGLPFYVTERWSDNNQLSTLAYYQSMISHIQKATTDGRLSLPMEFVLMNSAKENCRKWGQAVLGDRIERRSYLGHLDGRHAGVKGGAIRPRRN
jgi:hypothetical protein